MQKCDRSLHFRSLNLVERGRDFYGAIKIVILAEGRERSRKLRLLCESCGNDAAKQQQQWRAKSKKRKRNPRKRDENKQHEQNTQLTAKEIGSLPSLR